MGRTDIIEITDTSPASATTAAGASTVDISRADWFQVYLEVQGGTGGTLDVYIQAKVSDYWVDWYHHPQMTAGAAAQKRSIVPEASVIVSTVGTGTSPALASGTCVGGFPGTALRFCFVAGASTSAGAAQTMKVIRHRAG